MKICVIGTGYVGLVTGTCFAEAGNEVFCVDIDAKKVEALKNGIIPIYEPGLEPMVKENVAAERLHFTTDLALALNQSAIAFIAVGTPPNEDGSADLSHVLGVAAQIAKLLQKKSSSPLKARSQLAPEIKLKLSLKNLSNIRLWFFRTLNF